MYVRKKRFLKIRITLVRTLFKDTVASNYELINELWIENAVEEGCHDPFQSSIPVYIWKFS